MLQKAILVGLMLLPCTCVAQSGEEMAGQSAGGKEKQCAVVRSWQEWAILWAKHRGSLKILPDVDFSKEMIVAVFLSERSTGGYKVELQLMADPLRPQSRLVVFYREAPPPAGGAVIQLVTRPFAMRKTPKFAEVVFEADQAMRIPEGRQAPKSVFTPDNIFHIQTGISGLRKLAEDSSAGFK